MKPELIAFFKENRGNSIEGMTCMVIGKDAQESIKFRDEYLKFDVFTPIDEFKWANICDQLDFIITLPNWQDGRSQYFIDKVEEVLTGYYDYE